jgi:hypothetical protein
MHWARLWSRFIKLATCPALYLGDRHYRYMSLSLCTIGHKVAHQSALSHLTWTEGSNLHKVALGHTAQRSLAQVHAPKSCSHRRVLYSSFCCACTTPSSAEIFIILMTESKDFHGVGQRTHFSTTRESQEASLVELPTFSSNCRSSSPTFLAWSSCSPRCLSSHRTAS